MTGQKLFAGDDSTGDNHLLDFRCPFIQRNNPGITVHSFDGIVFHIAVAAMDLKGFIGDIYSGIFRRQNRRQDGHPLCCCVRIDFQ